MSTNCFGSAAGIFDVLCTAEKQRMFRMKAIAAMVKMDSGEMPDKKTGRMARWTASSL